ncbi:MAG: hypothetical protein IJ013_02495 [Bacteroidaceae bacterium]|nr:hypothetical protein [Bacteroidaceae bacterium]
MRKQSSFLSKVKKVKSQINSGVGEKSEKVFSSVVGDSSLIFAYSSAKITIFADYKI